MDRTLPSKSESNVASSSSAVGPNHEPPALFTRTSASPDSSARRRTSAVSLKSAATNRARPPSTSICVTTSPPRCSAFRPCTTTVQPSLASCCAVARPMPDVAPVTRPVPSASAGSAEAMIPLTGQNDLPIKVEGSTQRFNRQDPVGSRLHRVTVRVNETHGRTDRWTVKHACAGLSRRSRSVTKCRWGRSQRRWAARR